MSWTPTGGFTAGTPFRALSANVASFNVQSEQNDPNSLLDYYKALIHLRNSMPSLSQGDYQKPSVQSDVLVFFRTSGSERALVAINYDTSAALFSIAQMPVNAPLTPRYPASAATVTTTAAGTATIAIPAQSVMVYTY